uniref:Uncharacterized protein n=2 Tax=Eucampia antarctica TaxID=49252 RepID=A0A7S2S024_9STRA|mmetsp:Transcript_2911/g.2802  ORF Transcript_2911/g.2802 Transcript_2911/m.2802 type:complete len:555 (+) Transcript_2911:86-1750(+)
MSSGMSNEQDIESMKMDPPQQSLNKKRNLLLCVGSLAVVALTIGLSVGLTRGKGEERGNVQEPTKLNKQDFSRSSSFIDQACSMGNRVMSDSTTGNSTGNMFESTVNAFCETECEVAQCCDPFSSDDSSCVSSQASLASCVAYAKCQVEGYPAALDLPTMCSMEQISENSTACAEACDAATCCFADDVNDQCFPEMFMMCMDYAPCQNLRVNTMLPVAPHNLDEICSNTDKEQCKNICDAASCCVDDPGNEDNCFSTNFITCTSYAACGFLLLDLPNNKVPEPSNGTDFAEICSPSLLMSGQDGARDDCINTCEQAECCTASGVDMLNNCFFTDPFGCLEYATCSYLEVTGGSVPAAPENITELCSLENILDSSSGSDCADICEAPEASCCFEWTSADNCVDDGNAYACGTYYPCLSMLLSSGEVGNLQSPNEAIDEKCSLDSVQENSTACEELCEPAVCCTSIDDNCFFNNADVCGKYIVNCANLVVPTGDLEAAEPPENIGDICSPFSFITGRSQECSDLCVQASPCCTEMGDESCLLNSPTQCAKWALYCI